MNNNNNLWSYDFIYVVVFGPMGSYMILCGINMELYLHLFSGSVVFEIELSKYRTVRISYSWNIELLEYRNVEISTCQNIDLSG